MVFLIPISTLLALLAVPVHGTNWPVNVGQNGALAFNPGSISGVSSRDVVSFSFNAPVHSATQSSFSTPCVASSGGFDTNLVSVSNSNNPTVVNWTVPEGDGPWWFFCKQTGHCGQGMVFAVNPTTNETFAAFKDLAQGITPPSTSSSSPSSGTVSSASTTATTVNPSHTSNGAISVGLGLPLAFSLLSSVMISTML